MNELAVYLAFGGLIAFSVLVLILAARGRDTHWAHKRDMRGWVTPTYMPAPPADYRDEHGRPM